MRIPFLHRVVPGLLLGLSALCLLRCQDGPPEEREWIKPWAPAAEVETWHEEWTRRVGAWRDVPDPPGTGPVERSTWWISRGSYEMEVRRRGRHFVLVTAGVDEQVGGGGWTAFGEGVITEGEDGDPFAGAVASFRWSCLSVRFGSASDGMGRVAFSDDGLSLVADYMANEAPTVWMRCRGVRQEDGKDVPARGTIPGQIPWTHGLATFRADATYPVRVRVEDVQGGRLAGALVGVAGQPETRVRTDAQGEALVAFDGSTSPQALSLAAGTPGYRNGSRVLFAEDARVVLRAGQPSREVLTIVLQAVDPVDHRDYAWVHPSPHRDPDDRMACGTCHGWQYHEWLGSRHARMADNGLVAWTHARMRREVPDAADDCAACHQPGHAATLEDPLAPTARWRPRGVLAGAHCDLCHKVAHVDDVRASGVAGSLVLRRPSPEAQQRPGRIHQVFGANPDVTYAWMGASLGPAHASSHLCAGCHQGGGHGAPGAAPKIDTFREWTAYAVAQRARDAKVESCQDCHMPGAATLDLEDTPLDQFAWDTRHRSPGAVHSHRFEGTSPAFAKRAVALSVEKRWDADEAAWVVEVGVRNVGAGHAIPTGTSSKHVVVGIWARQGKEPLVLRAGDRALVIDPLDAEDQPALAAGDWQNPAGLVLGWRHVSEEAGDAWRRPFFPAIRRAGHVVDDRLHPGAERRARAIFEGRADESPTVEVHVVHRRADLGDEPGRPPWSLRPQDAPPQVRWLRVVR